MATRKEPKPEPYNKPLGKIPTPPPLPPPAGRRTSSVTGKPVTNYEQEYEEERELQSQGLEAEFSSPASLVRKAFDPDYTSAEQLLDTAQTDPAGFKATVDAANFQDVRLADLTRGNQDPVDPAGGKVKSNPTSMQVQDPVYKLKITSVVDDPANERGQPDSWALLEHAEFSELVENIKARGQIEPAVVVSIGDGKYQLVSGHRRKYALIAAGESTINAVIRAEAAHQVDTHLDRLTVNLMRSDLNDLQKARGFRAALDADKELTQSRLAERMGMSQPKLANLLRLLKLPADIQKMIETGSLSSGHGIALLGLKQPIWSYQKEGPQGTLEESLVRIATGWAERTSSVRTAETDIEAYNRQTQAVIDYWSAHNAEKAQAAAAERERQEAAAKESTRQGEPKSASKVAKDEATARAERKEREETEARAAVETRKARREVAREAIHDAIVSPDEKGLLEKHVAALCLWVVSKRYGYGQELNGPYPKRDAAMREAKASNDRHKHIRMILNMLTSDLPPDEEGFGVDAGRSTEYMKEFRAWCRDAFRLDQAIADGLREAGLLPHQKAAAKPMDKSIGHQSGAPAEEPSSPPDPDAELPLPAIDPDLPGLRDGSREYAQYKRYMTPPDGQERWDATKPEQAAVIRRRIMMAEAEADTLRARARKGDTVPITGPGSVHEWALIKSNLTLLLERQGVEVSAERKIKPVTKPAPKLAPRRGVK
jgi:ParB/RepB/Spo0J family partition protein